MQLGEADHEEQGWLGWSEEVQMTPIRECWPYVDKSDASRDAEIPIFIMKSLFLNHSLYEFP